MRCITLILCVILLTPLWAANPVPKADDKDSFFNGKDLAGWEGLKEYWSVKDKTIVGATPDGLKFNTFLCSKKKYKDFELKFQVKLTGKGWPGNSGVQIRSEVFKQDELAVKGLAKEPGGFLRRPGFQLRRAAGQERQVHAVVRVRRIGAAGGAHSQPDPQRARS